jgi:Uma2 family endonuclease
MNVAVKPTWTAERFLNWVETQEGRYEFDGIRPVAMTGGNANHSRITLNIHRALAPRLRGTPCSNFGPDLGIQTIGEKVRFPDALITCKKFPGTERIAPNPVVVFEVISPSSGPKDHHLKLAEYQAVASILTYVIVESAFAAVLVYHREAADLPFVATPLTGDATLELPLLGVELPIAELYEDVQFADASAAEAPDPATDAKPDAATDGVA